MTKNVGRTQAVPSQAPLAGVAMTQGELERWGEELGRSTAPPMLVTISGELGAGKTTLIQSICRGYGVSSEVTSPTYTLVHEYSAPRSQVFHLDLYRLASERTDGQELTNLGWDEILSAHALVLIEWPERAQGYLPSGHFPIVLEHYSGDANRRLLLAG